MAMTISGTSGITYPNSTVGTSPGVGVGQSFSTNLYGSTRAYGTTYTNSTGKPIFVYIATSNSSAVTFSLSINGAAAVTYFYPNAVVASASMSFVVPNGQTYNLSVSGGTPTFNYWYEVS